MLWMRRAFPHLYESCVAAVGWAQCGSCRISGVRRQGLPTGRATQGCDDQKMVQSRYPGQPVRPRLRRVCLDAETDSPGVGGEIADGCRRSAPTLRPSARRVSLHPASRKLDEVSRKLESRQPARLSRTRRLAPYLIIHRNLDLFRPRRILSWHDPCAPLVRQGRVLACQDSAHPTGKGNLLWAAANTAVQLVSRHRSPSRRWETRRRLDVDWGRGLPRRAMLLQSRQLFVLDRGCAWGLANDEGRPLQRGPRASDAAAPLWDKQRVHHAELSRHFRQRVAAITFAERRVSIESKPTCALSWPGCRGQRRTAATALPRSRPTASGTWSPSTSTRPIGARESAPRYLTRFCDGWTIGRSRGS